MNRVNPSPAGRRRSALASLAGRALSAAALAAMLVGCNTTQEVTASLPEDYRVRHPIVIKEAEHTVQLFVGKNRGGLTPAQRADVLAFANSWRREATGGVVIDVPSETPNAAAAEEAVHEINSILAAAGVPPQGVALRPYSPSHPDRLAAVRLSYPRMAAEAGPCGMWPKDIGVTNTEYNENRPWWNFGCAEQRNLAAMVDNPADLVQPRGEAPAYTERRTVVLDKYRKGDSTLTSYPNTTNQDPRLTDIGK